MPLVSMPFFARCEPDYRSVGKGEKYIPKTAPKWTPKVGDAVFIVRGNDTDVSVVRFSHVDEHGIYRVTTAKGQIQGFMPSLVKPFDPAYIGKPWSEIPN
jgi:hypothetical protein